MYNISIMKNTIFYLEGRGGMYLYHFFMYNLSCLYFIENKIYNVRGQINTSVLLNDKSRIVEKPSNDLIMYPIKVYMTNLLPFQKEAFEILSDKVELITDLLNETDYEIVSIYGDTCLISISDNSKYTIPYLRNLFLERLNYNIIKGKRIYITRKNSESQHNGVLKRAIINEDEFKVVLNKYNIEIIQLEDFSMQNKIKLFMESELIISPHSGALTLTMFGNKDCKVIEILNNGTCGFNHSHYINICNTIGINYNKYSNINEDYNGNFNINLDDFEKYLLTIM